MKDLKLNELFAIEGGGSSPGAADEPPIACLLDHLNQTFNGG